MFMNIFYHTDTKLTDMYIPYDIGDFKTNKKYDVVIHLAANAAIREAIENPDFVLGK